MRDESKSGDSGGFFMLGLALGMVGTLCLFVFLERNEKAVRRECAESYGRLTAEYFSCIGTGLHKLALED